MVIPKARSARTRGLVLGLMLVAAGRVTAGPLEDGIAAWQQKDYVAAAKHWRPLAEAGDAEAQYRLGLLYGNGMGVPMDQVRAADWIRKAAEQGNVEGEAELGAIYTSRPNPRLIGGWESAVKFDSLHPFIGSRRRRLLWERRSRSPGRIIMRRLCVVLPRRATKVRRCGVCWPSH